jgi:eukaryotic-like serine/threonine-protein kinase
VVATIEPGAELKGRYRLERPLGHGGMASVWLGHDLTLDREVAVKVLSEASAFDPAFLARFKREARVAAGLSHPHLIDVYDFSDSPRPYLVMEYVPGENLSARLKGGGKVDCRRLAVELLEAVVHIHAAGIVHRDIKPHNILIAPGDVLKLIDFGIALPRDATALTQTGMILGTERYAAPEVRQGGPASERSDLYSCGVVMRECSEEDPALRSVIAWLTEEDPLNRPRSAAQALGRLRGGVAAAGISTVEYLPTFAEEGPTVEDSREGPREEPRREAREEPRREAREPFGPPAQRSRRIPRLLAAAAVLAAAAAVTVAIVSATGGGGDGGGTGPGAKAGIGAKAGGNGGGNRQASGAGASAEPTAEATSEPVTSSSAPVTSSSATGSVPEPEGEDPELGSALNLEGFELTEAGEYERAVPVLEEAVRAFPPGTEELEYAYALYNLGRALRLAGRPEDAIPVLERRLEIPDQTEAVSAELETARSEAG